MGVLEDGAHHEVDSSEWAFYQAAQNAMSETIEDGVWQILEPIMKVEVNGPEEHQGVCVSMLTKRGGLIQSVEQSEDWFTAEAEAPLNNMFGFSAELRSVTQGKGEYSMEYSRYAPTEQDVQEQIISAYEASLNPTSASDSASGASKKKKKN